MAGERKGKAYEALVHVALKDLVDEGKLSGPLHWNVTPEEMSIEPDFLTGADPNTPTTVLLLTYSGSAKNSWSKVWRNLGELVECKTILKVAPRVYCLTFGTMRESLEKLQESAFDYSVWVNPRTYPWVVDLDAFIASCVSSFPRGKDAQSEYIERELEEASKNVNEAYKQLKALLERLYKMKSERLDKLWSAHRSRTIPAPRSPMNTSYRRGLAKLRLLPKSLFANIVSGNKIKPFPGDQVFISLGLLKRVVGGHLALEDREAVFAQRHLTPGELAAVQNHPLPKGMSLIKGQVMDMANIPVYTSILAEMGDDLFEPDEIFSLFKRLNADPTLGRNCYVSLPNDVWAFRIMLEGIRHRISNRRQAYGYAQMVVEIKKAATDPKCKAWLKNRFSFDPSSLINSSEPVRRGLQDFLNRTRDGAISDAQLGIVSWVLAEKIRPLEIDWNVVANELARSGDSNALEARYLCHSQYEPLVELVLYANPEKKFERKIVCSAFSEMAGLRDAGVTTILVTEHTLINWQTCSDAGRDHKKKELCGRAIGLRYHWDGTAFIRRPGIQKMILVLDGTWRQSDIKALLRSGWDEIFYPDEMNQLAKAIV